MTNLLQISPIDGRYCEQTKILENYFSEFALIKYRLNVEIKYFIALCKIPLPELENFLNEERERWLLSIYESFSIQAANEIKAIENEIRHDVKAVENWLRVQFDKKGFEKEKEFIHFGLTSQDINNTAFPMMMRDAWFEVLYPSIEEILNILNDYSNKWWQIIMPARTHGQLASPTRLGKEIAVFIERLNNQLHLINFIPFAGKFGGAVGNFNAHIVAYPDIDWVKFSNEFLSSLGLIRLQNTTQIDHYDYSAAFFDALKRINNILLDLSRDFWLYIMLDYFHLKIDKREVGSSTMPHKVNPIDFENAEGNLGIANAQLEHLSNKLPISRLQRDLSDSTVLRNIGVPYAHSLIAYNSLKFGLNKLDVNKSKIDEDLDNHWEIIAEGIQTILRRYGYPNPYEALKQFTRGKSGLKKHDFVDFINQLDVNDEIKEKLLNLSPHNYYGI
ncbi:MAG: adenylosuccinate lyase [Bacteroidales bacterium]|jgi:adenylosuccinate lyase|nr:adenylosuccinate lyase [Bacteroidales bacterium]MDI9575125.1 adenylosuccinate lyase [Bacteroidota bacterium]MDD3755208.1 adenylosuccinate lyase [Bacteroidales bacterium]MDY0400335.1 adenylosuccinate lyase [Bacteroidales bacterium]HHW58654.1 adenylosuccinate lyase [Bacteroidales bacterium]